MSVRLHEITLLPLDGLAMNLIFEAFPKNCRQNSRSVKIIQEQPGALHEDIGTVIFRGILFGVKYVWEKSCTEIRNISCSKYFFF